jgi:hypothetical protein
MSLHRRSHPISLLGEEAIQNRSGAPGRGNDSTTPGWRHGPGGHGSEQPRGRGRRAKASTAIALVSIDGSVEDLCGDGIDAAPITSRSRRKATMYVVGDSEQ